jgi:acyl phosphate:glycerol-3-phosphate acyltransferase
MLVALGLVLFGYLLGSIPTGYWLVKALKGIDVRTIGSGSTGATNVLRSAGKGAAALVLLFDVFKGWLPVWVAQYAESQIGWSVPLADYHILPTVCGLAAMIGHSKSVFLKFQGGKSAATALGTVIGCQPLAGVCVFALWIFLVWSTRFVSVASITAGLSSPVFMFVFHAPIAYVIYCAIGALYVLARHRANIQRLMARTEPKLGQKT